METLKKDFSNISSHKNLSDLTTKYELTAYDSPDTFTLSTYTGTYKNHKIEITHKWRDRCKTFQVNPDGNEISITVKNASGDTVFQKSVKYIED